MSDLIREEIKQIFEAKGRNQIWLGDITYIPTQKKTVHTDQGAQYTGDAFRSLVRSHKAIISNSRKGTPYDNAPMESFYRTLKRELINDVRFKYPKEAKKEIFKYIETYYNTKRMHSAFGYLSPADFEKVLTI